MLEGLSKQVCGPSLLEYHSVAVRESDYLKADIVLCAFQRMIQFVCNYSLVKICQHGPVPWLNY